jgi:hypothetical protein
VNHANDAIRQRIDAAEQESFHTNEIWRAAGNSAERRFAQVSVVLEMRCYGANEWLRRVDLLLLPFAL